MNRFRTILFAAASVPFVLALAAASARAQDAATPTVTDTHTSGDWIVRCIRAQTSGCEMVQVMIERTHKTKVASVTIIYNAKSASYLGRFGAPLGVAFDTGLGLEFGSFRANNLQYKLCARDGCYVMGSLPPDMIDAMKGMGADKGAMDIQMIDGRKLQIPITLNGFADGIDLLKKWSVEKAGGSAKSDKE
jgi:invasion protein IalB